MTFQPSIPTERITVSPGEFATLTGLSVSTVYRRLWAGEIKYGRSGRRVLIPREELERLVRPSTNDQPAEVDDVNG